MIAITPLTAKQAQERIAELEGLLHDAVDSGASVGFLPPLSNQEAEHYWQTVISEVADGTKILLVAQDDTQTIVGTAQLALATKPNARHRAEVQKVLVLRRARQQGIGQALMAAIEVAAKDAGRSLLVLDTILGDAGERLYERIGFVRVGNIPQFASNAKGELEPTVLFYKIL